MTNALGIAILGAIQNGDDKYRMAEAVIKALADGAKPSHDEAVEIGTAIIGNWQHAGLFNGQPGHFPRPAGPPGDVIPWHLNYVSDHGGLSIETDDAQLAKELDVILSAFRTTSPATPGTEVFRCTTNSGDEMEIFHGRTPIWSRTDRDEARFLLLKEAAQSLSGHSRVGAVLHGAAVRAPTGRVLVFIGQSGAGKSTLSLGLVSKGWQLLADDHIPLAREGTSLIAFPTATAVKPGSMELEETKILRNTYGMQESERDGVSYLSLPHAAVGGALLPITAVITPRYGPDLDFKLERVTSEEAFSICIGSGARPCRLNPQISSLASLCNDVPTYWLDYQTSEQSLLACHNLAGT